MNERPKTQTVLIDPVATDDHGLEASPPQMAQRAHSRLASFGYAFAGIGHLFRTQRNAQIHAAISLAVVAAGLLFQVDRFEWLALLVTIMLVLAAEGINTAIEAVVDLASPQRHPLAKIAKDVAAGTVLMAAIGAVLVGMLVFLPHIWPPLISWLFDR